MLYSLRPGIKHPYERTYAWCDSVRDKTYEFRDRPDGGVDIIGYPSPIRAHFSGGRVWPDIVGNGSGYPHHFLSDAAIEILRHYDSSTKISEPIEVTYDPNKSLSRKGPPAYRMFNPVTTLPRAELSAEADSPSVFRVAGYENLCIGCTEFVIKHLEASKLRNFEFTPLFDYLKTIDRIRTT